jgi:hypothetical protein
MAKKTILVIPVIFLLVLTNCSLFEDSSEVNLIEPQDGDVLRQGESFMLIAETDFDYGVREVNVELWLPDGITDTPSELLSTIVIFCKYTSIIGEGEMGIPGLYRLVFLPLKIKSVDGLPMRCEKNFQ